MFIKQKSIEFIKNHLYILIKKMGANVYNFTKFGDASKELKELYEDGWRLKTVVTPAAVSMTEEGVFGKMFPEISQYIEKGKGTGTRYFLYAVEYFLEREN